VHENTKCFTWCLAFTNGKQSIYKSNTNLIQSILSFKLQYLRSTKTFKHSKLGVSSRCDPDSPFRIIFSTVFLIEHTFSWKQLYCRRPWTRKAEALLQRDMGALSNLILKFTIRNNSLSCELLTLFTVAVYPLSGPTDLFQNNLFYLGILKTLTSHMSFHTHTSQ
jgi:hypothetical protein